MSCLTTALAWVPQGAAAQFPTRYEFADEDYDEFLKSGRLQLEQAKGDLEEARNAPSDDEEADETRDSDGAASGAANVVSRLELDNERKSTKTIADDDDLAEYNLDTYDDSPANSGQEAGEGKTSLFNNIQSLVYHQPDEADPYITMKDVPEEDDEEREELQIMGSDNLILAAKIEDEVAHLEVYVYEDEVDNLYVHHDIMLPDIPLCLEWLDFPVGATAEMDGTSSAGNFVAIGMMSPDIEIWNLDVVDSLFPDAVLGEGGVADAEPSIPGKSKKKKKKSKKPTATHHVDAVLSLATNRLHRNLLASSSADTTIKLWDLPSKRCAQSYDYHSGKVSAVMWHPQQAPLLLSGSYDHSIAVADMRAPASALLRARTGSDVEGVQWSPWDENSFFVATESGALYNYDLRRISTSTSTKSSSKPVWTLHAHDESITAFDTSLSIPGLLATGSNDNKVKLWNVPVSVEPNEKTQGPSMIVSRDLGVGKVFSARFAPDGDMGLRLAVSGSSNSLQVWDTGTNAGVRHAFGAKFRQARLKQKVKERVDDDLDEERIVAVEDDEDEDGEESGGSPNGGSDAMDEDMEWKTDEENETSDGASDQDQNDKRGPIAAKKSKSRAR